MNTFNRDEIAKTLALKKADRDGDRVDTITHFNSDRFFNLVGTDPGDYKVAAGISSLAAGDSSDGLVRISNATTQGVQDGAFVSSPQAFVNRSHSGYFGIVNSEEGYQNLTRFLFGDLRADGFLAIDELSLPPEVQAELDAAKTVHASYLFEVAVSIRGKTWQLHRRTVYDGSAIFRKFDDMFPKRGQKRVFDATQSPLLFNVFLDQDQRVDMLRPSVAFAVDLCVRVPDYQVDNFLFLKNHFEGGYLFRDMLTVEATPPSPNNDNQWLVQYQFASKRGEPMQTCKMTDQSDSRLTFEIPVIQPNPPGIKARLRVVARPWNDW
jgi:hypothetical protein